MIVAKPSRKHAKDQSSAFICSFYSRTAQAPAKLAFAGSILQGMTRSFPCKRNFPPKTRNTFLKAYKPYGLDTEPFDSECFSSESSCHGPFALGTGAVCLGWRARLPGQSRPGRTTGLGLRGNVACFTGELRLFIPYYLSNAFFNGRWLRRASPA